MWRLFRALRALACLGCLLAVATVAWAQAAGQPAGVVRDNTGGVLPGASLTISGTALITPRTVITDEQDKYQIEMLSRGRYVELDLRVIAHATLDAADLDRASETLRKLLASAGVPSRWRDCSRAACSADLGSVAIDVLLLPLTKLTERDVHGEVTRDAITGVPTVLIYVPPIAERVRAIHSRLDGRSNPALATMQTGHLVGAAIAHEVGHALGLRHGARGVMKGRLTLDDALALRTSRLLFTASESATIRSTLRTARDSVAAAAR